MTDEAIEKTYDPTKYVLVPIAIETEKKQTYDAEKFGEYKVIKQLTLPCHAGVCKPTIHKVDEVIVLAHKIAKYYVTNGFITKVE